MLLDARLRVRFGQRLDVSSNVNRPDGRQRKSFLAAPREKAADSASVSEAGVLVPDVRGEKLEEAFFGMRAFA